MMKKLVYMIGALLLFTGCEKALKEYDEPSGRISGTVKSKAGNQPLKDIFVVYENTATGALHGTMSKADGSFTFGTLVTGEYKIFGVQDTMRMGGDTLRISVKEGKSVTLAADLLMEPAGVPSPEVPVLVGFNHNSVTLRVPYHDNGSVVTGWGFFYTTADREPTVSDTRKGASTYYDIIRKDYYEVVITGLRPATTYRFKSYLYVKNVTSLKFTTNNVVLSGNTLTVTTLETP